MSHILSQIQYVDPRTLKNSLLNIQLYGQDVDDELKEKIEKVGIKTPLILAADGETIVSGHRRKQIAVILGMKSVPVLVDKTLKTSDDIHEALILLNCQRERTAEQKAREYVILKEIATRRLEQKPPEKIDVSANGHKDLQNAVPGPLSTKPNGDTKVTAAAKEAAAAVKSSVTTMERAAKVIEKIDLLEEKGEPEAAEALRGKLNKSVKAAHSQVSAPAPRRAGKPKAGLTHQQQAKAYLRDAETLSRDMARLFQKVDQAVEQSGGSTNGYSERCMDTLSILNRLMQAWSNDV